MRIGKTQALAVTTTSAAATAIGAYTQTVRLVTDSKCFIALNRAATTSDMMLPPNWPEDFPVAPSDIVNALTATGTATLYITEKN